MAFKLPFVVHTEPLCGSVELMCCGEGWSLVYVSELYF